MPRNTRNSGSAAGGSADEPPSKRQREGSVEEANSFVECSYCPETMHEEYGSYFTLKCCSNKRLCGGCFSNLVEKMTNLHGLKCPTCDVLNDTWTRHRPPRRPTDGPTLATVPEEHELVEPEVGNNMQGRFISRGFDHKSIGVTVMHKTEGTDEEPPEYKTYSDILNAFDTNEWSKEQIAMFESIFKLFHVLFIKEDKSEAKTFDPVEYPTGESINQMAAEDTSVLRRLICCLAYGQTLDEVKATMKDNDGDKSFWRVLKTTFAASDLIGSLRNENRESLVKAMIGVHCAAQAAPDNLFAILNDFNLAPSKKTMNQFFMKEANEKIIQGFDFGLTTVYCYCSMSYDNEGFRVRGGTKNRVGYLQTTHRRPFFHPVELLTKHKLYADLDDPEGEVLSREPTCDWDEERQKDDFAGWKDIKKPNDDDYNNLSEVVYQHVDHVLQYESEGKFPTYEEARARCLDSRFDSSNELPRFREFGMRKVIDAPDGHPQLETTLKVDWRDDDNADNDDEQDGTIASSFVVNDAPMEDDLNKEATVKALIDYTELMRTKLLENSSRVPDRHARWVELQKHRKIAPLLEDFTVALCGDGAPSYMMTRLKRTVAEYKNLIIGFGGFHLGLTAWKGTGSLFGGAVSRPMLKLNRPTEAQQKWVLQPGDPNQVEEATAIIITVLYVDAERGLIRTKLHAGELSIDDYDGKIELSSDEVIEHMLERARKYPVNLVLLGYLRAMHVIQMLGVAEKQTSIELYLSSLKFIGLLVAISHHTDYVSMVADFFAMWHCASPALKKLFEVAVLFRKTKHGKTVFTDHEMEDFIGDSRLFLGKFCNGTVENHLDSLRKLVMNMETLMEARGVTTAASNSNREGNKSRVRINSIFCEVLLYCFDANLHGPGHVCKVPADKKFAERQGMEYEVVEPFEFFSLEGEEMNPDSCFSYTRSLEVDEEYFDCYLVNGDPNDPQRSEGAGGVCLALIDPLSNQHDARLKKEMARINELNEIKLATPGVYNVKELKEEFRKLKVEVDALKNHADPAKSERYYKMYMHNGNPNRKGNKTNLIGAVVQARKTLAELDPSWQQARLDALTSEQQSVREEQSADIESRMKTELQEKYFTLDDTTGKNAVGKKKHSIEIAKALSNSAAADEGAAEGGDDDEGAADTQQSSQGFSTSLAAFSPQF